MGRSKVTPVTSQYSLVQEKQAEIKDMKIILYQEPPTTLFLNALCFIQETSILILNHSFKEKNNISVIKKTKTRVVVQYNFT